MPLRAPAISWLSVRCVLAPDGTVSVIADAVNLDTEGEATAYLDATGQLPTRNLRKQLSGASGSILWGANSPFLGRSMNASMNSHTLGHIDEAATTEQSAAAAGKGTARLTQTGRHTTTLPTANSLNMYIPAAGASVGLTMSLGQNNSALFRSFRRQGYPTVSQPLEPGPYHKANAQLRKQLAQYHATVTVRTVWRKVGHWVLAFVAWAVYVGVRLAYLAKGKTAELMGSPRASSPYSIIILITEFLVGLINFAGSMTFRKQEVKFSRSEDPEEQQDANVRSRYQILHH